MSTMSTFVAYSSSLTGAVTKFLSDPMAETEEAKVKQRWTVLERFEINFDHNARVSWRRFGREVLMAMRCSFIWMRSHSEFDPHLLQPS